MCLHMYNKVHGLEQNRCQINLNKNNSINKNFETIVQDASLSN